MPACVPVNNNNVGDINDNAKPAGQTDSKLSKIISCLFLRKKTDVVDMTKESAAAAKKQKLSVDRSERSRRVLKMESMRTAPKAREETDATARVSQGQNQMFLPSENPTASFLSYLNPSVRRACSEVIRTNGTPSNTKPTREAFTESRRKIHTRNTNYRGQQASENGISKNGGKNQDGKPTKPPDRQSSVKNECRKPIVVPGIMSQSDDDNGYDSDNEISDLQDEMRRMNLSQPDLRSRTSGKTRRREGSISLSEESEEDEKEQNKAEDRERPQNPSPNQKRDNTKPLVAKQQSMEEVIDDLFQQTQHNIDTIYKNGIESMDLETYRSDTMTPETYVKRFEEDLLKSQADEQSNEERTQHKSAVKEEEKGDTGKKQTHLHHYQPNDVANPHMENLLSEVSIWAQDRQRWLLEDGDHVGNEASTRESTVASMTTDGRVIEHVTQTNKDKCNEWVNEKFKPQTQNKINTESKANGILTGPKLFRSTSKNPVTNRVSFGEKSQSSPEKDLKSNTSNTGLQIIDIGKETEDLNELPDLDTTGSCPAPWTSDMYTSTPRGDQQDRSTINDNFSELDEQFQFRARSPDSWLSSNGSCSNVLNKTSTSVKDANEGFDTPTPTKQIETPVKITASNVGKSHQIMRITPKVHTPFRGLDRQVTPMPTEPNTIPSKPMLRNTQLKPLTVLRTAKSRGMIDNFPILPGYRGGNNMPEETNFAANQTRPFSEIPLRTDMRGNDRNSSLLAHSSSARETLEQQERSLAQTSLRPVSETMPPKRIDKIGVGPIMATKEKQMYARDVMNAMEKHRLQPQHGAFQDSVTTSTPPNEPLIEYDDVKEKEPSRKRHKVFTNSLMTGGYNYDKHSRRKPSEQQPEVKPSESGENVNFSTSLGSKTNNPATRSVNDLSFSIRDNSNNPASPRYSQDRLAQNQSTMNGNFPDTQTRLNRANASQSFNIGNTQGTDKKRENKSQSFQNKYTAVQSHGLGVSPSHGLGLHTSSDVSHSQTANKFRQIRSRRDQEMEWLMKDAAETEV
ncbi:uncharacterized protein LOC123527902 isoform X2 [Mercenaria mercenaria]|nr:uncharacterized protein LOC123527902 isoform X2 [Mercenaria mercenaria]